MARRSTAAAQRGPGLRFVAIGVDERTRGHRFRSGAVASGARADTPAARPFRSSDVRVPRRSQPGGSSSPAGPLQVGSCVTAATGRQTGPVREGYVEAVDALVRHPLIDSSTHGANTRAVTTQMSRATATTRTASTASCERSRRCPRTTTRGLPSLPPSTTCALLTAWTTSNLRSRRRRATCAKLARGVGPRGCADDRLSSPHPALSRRGRPPRGAVSPR
jgi:hypothetical protein